MTFSNTANLMLPSTQDTSIGVVCGRTEKRKVDSDNFHHHVLCFNRLRIALLLPKQCTFVLGHGLVCPWENRHTSFPSNNHNRHTVHHKLCEKGASVQADALSLHNLDEPVLHTIPKDAVLNPLRATYPYAISSTLKHVQASPVAVPQESNPYSL